ncbi:putative transcription factor C3H family [Arabidopsis thaliana]|uniref:C3H1-type domain-containing protein n=1 Tax=Arabidopsis thaliana TaxID=3702 RepID=A0A5S9WE33_ARATH|nr:unnamed protein product [Arabidopsis thaliana]
MADAGDNQRISDEKESISTEETKENEDLGSGRNDTGHHVYNEGHEEVLEYLKQERLKDADMQRKRHETESKSIEGTTPDIRLSDSGKGSDERTDKIQKADSVYKRSNADTRVSLPQQRRLKDVVEAHRVRRETESRLWHQERDRSLVWGGSEPRMRFDESTQGWRDSDYESKWRFHERTPDWDWRDSESRMRSHERTQDRRGSESQGVFDERTERRQEPVRWPGEECWCLRCRNGGSCRYNHPTQLPQELPVRNRLQICRYFLRGYCKFGSVCGFQHIRDRDVAEPMYENWSFDVRTQRRYEIEYSGFRPEKRAKTSLDSVEPDSRKRLEGLENKREQENPQEPERQRTEAQDNLQEFREQENPQNQIQINTERQRTMAHDNLQIVSDSRMHDPRRHDTELRLEREKMVNRELEKQRIEHLIDPLVRRYMQAKRDKEVEQRERASIESQRIVAQEILRQQRLQGMRENQNVDSRMHDPRRHDTELRLEREKMVNRELEKQRIEPLIGPLVRRYMQAKRDKEVEQRERASIESQRIVAQENLRQQRLQGMRENQNVDAHDQEKTQELGFKGKEGDGV